MKAKSKKIVAIVAIFVLASFGGDFFFRKIVNDASGQEVVSYLKSDSEAARRFGKIHLAEIQRRRSVQERNSSYADYTIRVVGDRGEGNVVVRRAETVDGSVHLFVSSYSE